MPAVMTLVIAGPSLPPDVRPSVGRLRWHPPARRGDLDALQLPAGARVVLVDGVMVRDHPPSPSEVHRLIQRGHEVWGCSSLGALRAVELRHLGMRGYGWVYERVLDRSITADDELVAPLDPRSGTAVGLFLANLRFGLDQLVEQRLATSEQRQLVVSHMTATHFELRTACHFRQVAQDAGISEAGCQAVLDADVKRQDALQLVDRLARQELAA